MLACGSCAQGMGLRAASTFHYGHAFSSSVLGTLSSFLARGWNYPTIRTRAIARIVHRWYRFGISCGGTYSHRVREENSKPHTSLHGSVPTLFVFIVFLFALKTPKTKRSTWLRQFFEFACVFLFTPLPTPVYAKLAPATHVFTPFFCC